MSPADLSAKMLKIPKVLAMKMARGNSYLEEELESAGNEELVRSCYRYNPENETKATVETYLYASVKYRMWREIARRKKRLVREVSLDSDWSSKTKNPLEYDGGEEKPFTMVDSSIEDPAEVVEKRDEAEKILSLMSSSRRKEVEALAAGYTGAELADSKGINRSTFNRRLVRAKEKAIGKIYPMYLHFRVGSRVRLVTPYNARLNNAMANIVALEEWGAHVSTDAAGAGKFRALWEEMQPIEFLNGEAKLMTNAEIETVVDVSEEALKIAASETVLKSIDAKASRDLGYTGDACDLCGSFQVKRVGACTYCEGCNTSGGCS